MSAAAENTAGSYDFDDQGFESSVEQLVPRIDIEAFCTTSEMATAMQEAAYDRRMARTSIAVAMGGADRATETYADTDTPHLLIVESDADGLAVFDELEKLAEVCDPDTKVIVCGPSNDVTLYRELKRQGVDEYIVSPAAPMQVIEAIASVFSDPSEAPLARTIGFVGVKGGCGSSTLAHNAAWMIGQMEKKEVLLVDLDVQFGTAGLDFNREPTRSVVDALGSVDELDDVKLQRLLIEYDDHLSILAAPASLEVISEFEESSVIDMVQLIREATDFAVFDIPHVWTPWVQRAIMQMDEIVLVATPELASLRNLKALYDMLVSRRPNDAPPRLVLNNVGMPKRPEIAVNDVAEIVGRDVDLIVPFEPTLFGSAANNGQMVQEINPKHEVVSTLRTLCGSTISKPGTIRKSALVKDSGSLLSKLKGVNLGTLTEKFGSKKPKKKT